MQHWPATASPSLKSTRILDLSPGSGAAIHAMLQGIAPSPSNIYMSYIHGEQVNEGARRFGCQLMAI
jgi:hypothetical protein